MKLENYTDNFFEVNSVNGFLPKKGPLSKLPERYNELQKLIDEMPIKKEDGSDGLLSRKGAIEEGVQSLSNLKDLVTGEDDVLSFRLCLEHMHFLQALTS